MYITVSNKVNLEFLNENQKLSNTSIKHYLQRLKSQYLYYTLLTMSIYLHRNQGNF